MSKKEENKNKSCNNNKKNKDKNTHTHTHISTCTTTGTKQNKTRTKPNQNQATKITAFSPLPSLSLSVSWESQKIPSLQCSLLAVIPSMQCSRKVLIPRLSTRKEPQRHGSWDRLQVAESCSLCQIMWFIEESGEIEVSHGICGNMFVKKYLRNQCESAISGF